MLHCWRGPAGLVLALLLARKGVETALLEMHTDFDRDFLGDFIHPSTMELMDQLGARPSRPSSAFGKAEHRGSKRIHGSLEDHTSLPAIEQRNAMRIGGRFRSASDGFIVMEVSKNEEYR
jgi:2-polyprenyl-6-methoxyphenol hydroxylase-like FAD-dependent oxidoreductase